MSAIPNFDPLESAGNWNEPVTPYGKVKGRKIKAKKGKKSTVYPFNKVYESESGHIIEVDDTPGAERLHQFHRSGTFEEIHPNGDKVDKVVRDRYTSVLRDDYVHIDGNQNLTVDKALKIYINADKGRNTPNRSTNFDIEVGDNANINILVNKGNCNVKMKNGDVNLLLARGDVNIRQEAGSYNHFVNGDYNLEVAGHMHIVVGEDHVTEIGGNRDARIDGFFDHTMVTFGEHEINCPIGGISRICKSRQDVIELNHDAVIGVKRSIHIGLSDDIVVLGDYSVRAGNISVVGLLGASLGSETGGGMDVLADGSLSIMCPSHYSITAPKISFTSLVDMDISSLGSLRMGAPFVSVTSAAATNITSTGPLELLSSTAILQTAPMIHLNGPPATPGDPPSMGLTGDQLVRLIKAVKPPMPFVYVPGMVGTWRRTINGVTPLMLVRTTVITLKTQLAVLDTVINTVDGLSQQSSGLITAIKGITESITSTVATVVGPITDAMDKVSNAVNDVVDQVSEVVDKVTDQVTTIQNAIEDVAMGAVKELNSAVKNGLEPATSALGQVKQFISSIITSIADFACEIMKVINALVEGLIKEIQGALSKIMEGIESVLEAINKVIAWIQKAIQDMIEMINKIIKGILDAAGEFIDGVISGIEGIFEGIGVTEECGATAVKKSEKLLEAEALMVSFLAPGSTMDDQEFLFKLDKLKEEMTDEDRKTFDRAQSGGV